MWMVVVVMMVMMESEERAKGKWGGGKENPHFWPPDHSSIHQVQKLKKLKSINQYFVVDAR